MTTMAHSFISPAQFSYSQSISGRRLFRGYIMAMREYFHTGKNNLAGPANID